MAVFVLCMAWYRNHRKPDGRCPVNATTEEKRHYALLGLQLLVLCILVAWDSFGLMNSLYGQLFWWDIIAHLLGGMWAALCFAWM